MLAFFFMVSTLLLSAMVSGMRHGHGHADTPGPTMLLSAVVVAVVFGMVAWGLRSTATKAAEAAAPAEELARPADLDATVALLSRRARPRDEWHAELHAMAGNDGHYRVVSLREDTLLHIREDEALPDDAREAAELVLRVRRR